MVEANYVKCLCSHCSGRIEFPEHGAGQGIVCPHCGTETELYHPSRDLRPEDLVCPCLHCGAKLVFHQDCVGLSFPCEECGKETMLFRPSPPLSLVEPITTGQRYFRGMTDRELSEMRTDAESQNIQEPPRIPLPPYTSSGGEMPGVMPCKGCGGMVATKSERCGSCGQLWPGLHFRCPRCQESQFHIGEEENQSSVGVWLPAGLVGTIAYALGSLFQHAIDRGCPGKRFLRCDLCGYDFEPPDYNGRRLLASLRR